MIDVIIVDDHEMFRLGLKTAIASRHPDLRVVGEAESGAELFDLLTQMSVDLILLDIALPDTNGIEIARRVKTERPEIKIIAVSAENAAQTVQQMIETGIEGFISKRYGGVDTFATAIRTVMLGINYFGSDISDILYGIYVAKKKTTNVTSEFTEQEKRIIELCSEGLPGKLVADKLGITISTVNNHKNNIFRKLGITNTMEMVQYALKKGIIQID